AADAGEGPAQIGDLLVRHLCDSFLHAWAVRVLPTRNHVGSARSGTFGSLKTHTENRRPESPARGRVKRWEEVRQALASVRLEGLEPGDEVKHYLADYGI